MTERMSNSEQHEGGFNMADAGRNLVNEAQGWGSPGEESGRLSLEDWILNSSEVRNAPPWSCPPHLHVATPSSIQGHRLKEFPHSST